MINDKSIQQEEGPSLWRLMKQGDTSALNTLFNNYYNDLYFYGLKFVKNQDQVVDAIQDIFAIIWETRRRIAQAQYVKAYLFAMLRNNLLKHQSKNPVKRNTDSLDREFGFDISPEEIYLQKESELEKVNIVKNLLSGLSSKQKEIVYLKFYSNYTNIEISKILYMKPQSVANLLSRTLNLLRKKKTKGLQSFFNLLLFMCL